MELGLYNHYSKDEPYIVDPENTLVIGKTKMGKSFLLELLAYDEITNGSPIIYFGNGDALLKLIPEYAQANVLYFNPALYPFELNVLSNVPKRLHALLSSILGEVFLPADATPYRASLFKRYFPLGIQTLLNSRRNYTLIHLKNLFTNRKFRNKVLGEVDDPILHDLWNDFESLPPKEQPQHIESILTSLSAVLREPVLRECLVQNDNRMVFKDKVVIVDLNEAEMGKDNVHLFGTLVLALVYMAGLQGLKTTLFVDGAYRYGTSMLELILMQCPSITTIYSLQTLKQMQNPVSERIVAFRTTLKDAELLEPELQTKGFTETYRLAPYEAYVQKPTGRALYVKIPNYVLKRGGQKNKILRRCRIQCSAPRDVIEQKLRGLF